MKTNSINKSPFFYLLLFLMPFNIYSQGTVYVKVAETGTLQTVEKVSSGGYISTGWTSTPNIDLQVFRWDDQFNIIWSYTFTDSKFGSGTQQKIIESTDGNFFLRTTSPENAGSVIVVKFSSNGDLLWQRNYSLGSDLLNTSSFCKAIIGDNGFVFGGGCCAASNYLIKCNEFGNIEWQKRYSILPSSGVGTLAAILADGHEYVGISSYNGNSMIIEKIDSAGNITSFNARTNQANAIGPIQIVKLENSDGYAVLGNHNDGGYTTKAFVAIFNNTLELLTFNTLTIPYQELCLYNIRTINNGANIIINGAIYDSGFDGVLINLSDSGSIVWKKRMPPNTPQQYAFVTFNGLTTSGTSILTTANGVYEGCAFALVDQNGDGLCSDIEFNLSSSQSTLQVETPSITPFALNAVDSIKYYTYITQTDTSKVIICGEIPPPLQIETVTSDLIQIYPNPVQSEFKIQGCGSYPIRLSIYSLTGCKLFETPIGQSETTTSVDFLPSGYYILKIDNGNDVQLVRQFLKE